MGKKVTAAFDVVGYHLFPDDTDQRKAREVRYLAKGESATIPDSEAARLAELGAIVGSESPDVAPEVTTPAGTPTDEPSNPDTADELAGTFDAKALLDKSVEEGRAPNANAEYEEGSNAAALDDLTVPVLKKLAEDNDVDVPSKATKASLVEALDQAGVSADQASG